MVDFSVDKSLGFAYNRNGYIYVLGGIALQGVNPNRLREIRILHNMKLDNLASILGITKQAVSKYEHGKSIPSSDSIEKIISTFEIPRNYLLKESIKLNGKCSPLFFRASSATTKGHMDYAGIISGWGYEIVNAIDKSPQEFPDYAILEEMPVPEKALALRKEWDIDSLPIENLTELLEQHGFYIFVIDSAELETDAYSRIINDIPIIVINKHKGTAVRWRFNLAHELGHLVMHNRLSEWEFRNKNKEFEQEANTFAEYFLMPTDAFERSIIAPKLDYFIPLKEYWGVSIGAMIYHCGQIGSIDSHKVKSLQIQMGSQGWKKNEPLDDVIGFETPTKVRELILGQVTNESSFNSFYAEVCLPIGEIERICCLPTGYLSSFESIVIQDHSTQKEFEQLTLFVNEGGYHA